MNVVYLCVLLLVLVLFFLVGVLVFVVGIFLSWKRIMVMLLCLLVELVVVIRFGLSWFSGCWLDMSSGLSLVFWIMFVSLFE